MVDNLSNTDRSRAMKAVRSKGNKTTEEKLCTIMRAARISGWRRHPDLPGQPDFVFRDKHLVVFVDGCYWHGCDIHCRLPSSNRNYWQTKISRTVDRDRRTNQILRKAGWRVIRIWEHDLGKNHVKVVSRLKHALYLV